MGFARGEVMKKLVCVFAANLVFTTAALAQEPDTSGGMTTESNTPTGTVEEPAPSPESTAEPEEEEKEEKKRKLYSKRIRGLLWIEGTVGPSRLEPTRIRALDLEGIELPDASFSGPEYGVAAGVQLGPLVLGLRYKTARYDGFDFDTLSLDIGFLFRFVPYVQPYAHILLNYNFTRGGFDLLGFTDVEADGGGGTVGAGVRIPVIKWISVGLGFDYTITGLAVRGTDTNTGVRVSGGTAGNQFAGVFALTFHLL